MPLKYRPITEKAYRHEWADCGLTLEELNADREQQHQADLASAQGIMLAYIADLARVGNDRELISPIRDQMRSDELFWKHSRFIAELTGDSSHWHYAVVRSEARRAARSAAEHWEKVAQERAARIAAERAVERAQVESLPTFGMF